MTKKRVLALALIVALIAVLVPSTFAWFNAKDTIKNNFMMADSDSDGTEFGVDVWETENDNDPNADQDGDDDNNKTQAGNTYTEVAPGDKLAKNPTVENTGDYAEWVRVYVTFTNYSRLEDACVKYDSVDDSPIKMLNVDTTSWVYGSFEEDTTANTGTYLFYLNRALEPGQTAQLFDTVTIPGEFQMEDMDSFSEDKFEIIVYAEAIQSKNTGDNAQDGFTKWNPDYAA